MVPTTCLRPMYYLSTRKSALRMVCMAESWIILCSVLVICREGWIPARLVKETWQLCAGLYSKLRTVVNSRPCFRVTLEVHWPVRWTTPVLFMVWWVGETNVEGRTSQGSTHGSLTFCSGYNQRFKQLLHKQPPSRNISINSGASLNMPETVAKELVIYRATRVCVTLFSIAT